MRVFALVDKGFEDYHHDYDPTTPPALFTTREGAERYANEIELTDYTIEECEVNE